MVVVGGVEFSWVVVVEEEFCIRVRVSFVAGVARILYRGLSA